jgi:serine protease Do
VNYGALITPDDQNNPAIIEGSPAQKAGIGLNDIILEINGVKLTGKNTLLSMIQRFKPGDKIGLKIQRGDKVIIRTVVLDEFK